MVYHFSLPFQGDLHDWRSHTFDGPGTPVLPRLIAMGVAKVARRWFARGVVVREKGLEPSRPKAPGPKPGASTSSATRARRQPTLTA